MGGDDEETNAETNWEDGKGDGSDHGSNDAGGVGKREEERERFVTGLCVESGDGGGIDFARDARADE